MNNQNNTRMNPVNEMVQTGIVEMWFREQMKNRKIRQKMSQKMTQHVNQKSKKSDVYQRIPMDIHELSMYIHG